MCGVVWKVNDSAKSRVLAIKVQPRRSFEYKTASLPEDRGMDTDRELEVWKLLKHPYVLPLVDHFVDKFEIGESPSRFPFI